MSLFCCFGRNRTEEQRPLISHIKNSSNHFPPELSDLLLDPEYDLKIEFVSNGQTYRSPYSFQLISPRSKTQIVLEAICPIIKNQSLSKFTFQKIEAKNECLVSYILSKDCFENSHKSKIFEGEFRTTALKFRKFSKSKNPNVTGYALSIISKLEADFLSLNSTYTPPKLTEMHILRIQNPQILD